MLDNEDSVAMKSALKASSSAGTGTEAGWTKRATIHGFVDFNHLHRPVPGASARITAGRPPKPSPC